MEEIKTDEKQETEEPTATDKEEGIQPETNRLVEDTNLAAKRLEDATSAAKEERIAREQSYANMKLGGRGERGEETKPEFTDEEKASRARIKAVGDVTGSAWAKKYE